LGEGEARLMNGRETWTQLEENKRRHELHVRAIGRDKSHYDLTNFEFDKVVAELRAIIDPNDLRGQLRQANMQATRLNWGLRKLMRELDVNYSYVQGIVKQMNEHGQLGSSRLDALNTDDLRKVMIALREHKRRGGGTVKQPRVYVLEPA
jgi:predicted unusual protein kinase regulating ubiquinone biosynthesis (AarF/ABC1/UbiB family)